MEIQANLKITLQHDKYSVYVKPNGGGSIYSNRAESKYDIRSRNPAFKV